MALTDTQIFQLKAKLDGRHVKTRNANGTELHYVEGWHVIAEANRIFGYDAWDRRTLSTNCVFSSPAGQNHVAAYTAKVRISVRAGDTMIVTRRVRNRRSESLLPQARRTSSHSRAPRRMPPSGRLPHSATPSGLPSTTASKVASADVEAQRWRLP